MDVKGRDASGQYHPKEGTVTMSVTHGAKDLM